MHGGNDCLVILLIVLIDDDADMPAHHSLQLAHCLRHGLILSLGSSSKVCRLWECPVGRVYLYQLLAFCLDCQFAAADRLAAGAATRIIAALSLS